VLGAPLEDASDIVLHDDNFSSVVKGMEQGLELPRAKSEGKLCKDRFRHNLAVEYH